MKSAAAPSQVPAVQKLIRQAHIDLADGELDEAIKSASAALVVAMDDANLWSCRAQCWYRKGEYAKVRCHGFCIFPVRMSHGLQAMADGVKSIEKGGVVVSACRVVVAAAWR